MMRNIWIKMLIAMLMATSVYGAEREKTTSVWREDFDISDDCAVQNIWPAGWALKATKLGVPKTTFYLMKDTADGDGWLVVQSEKSTGGLLCNPSVKVDLKKTPILRWRWSVQQLPEGGDGRKAGKDDQAIGIYIGANDWLMKKTIAYRWETDTPVGTNGESSYAGIVKVKWQCIRDKNSGIDVWYVEERNIAEDFKKAFGFIPAQFALTVSGNSQYTKSRTLAKIDYIEFVAAKRGNEERKLAQRMEK
ncbi:MAG: DUF3047 domain-containing protein [Victivallaceae bacterium]